MVTIRPARADEIAALQRIERSAAQAFRVLDAFSWLADGDVMATERHHALIGAGTAWVAADEDGQPIGFLGAEIAGPELHIAEVSVDRPHQGAGIGRRLVRHAVEAAATRGLAAVTLTTFRAVAWNGPFYERLGFRTLDEADLPPRLRAVLDDEAAHGLPRDARCAMRLAFPAAG